MVSKVISTDINVTLNNYANNSCYIIKCSLYLVGNVQRTQVSVYDDR